MTQSSPPGIPPRRRRWVGRLLVLTAFVGVLLWLFAPETLQRGRVAWSQTWAGLNPLPGPAAAVADEAWNGQQPVEPEPVGIDRSFREESGRHTVADRLQQYGPAARARLAPHFARVGQTYPPARIRLVGLKAERILEVWTAPAPDAPLTLLHRYPILGASGGPGPKLREGDRQVPEGLYPIVSLNPNSAIHLSMRIGYPGSEDAAHARAEGRQNLGGDIMIHGGRGSIGCLAIGNRAIEELFTLVAETGVKHTDIVLSPVDFRQRELPPNAPAVPAWMPERYQRIRQILAALDPA